MDNFNQILKEKFVGKRVEAPLPARDRQGKVIPNKFTTITGQCSFAGYNVHLDWYQITINRTPVILENLKAFEKIKII